MKFLFRGTSKSTAAASSAVTGNTIAPASNNEAASTTSGESGMSKNLFKRAFMTKPNPVTSTRTGGGSSSKSANSSSKPKKGKQKQQKRRQSLKEMDVPLKGSPSSATSPAQASSGSGRSRALPTADQDALIAHSGFGLLQYISNNSRFHGSSRSGLTSSTTTNGSMALSSSTISTGTRSSFFGSRRTNNRPSCLNNSLTHSALVEEYTALIEQEQERMQQNTEIADDSEAFQPTVATATTNLSGTTTIATESSSSSPFSARRRRSSHVATVDAVEEGSKEDGDAQSSSSLEERKLSNEFANRHSSLPQHQHRQQPLEHMPPIDVSHIHCQTKDPHLHHHPDDDASSLLKDHAFQLIPNAHKEFGMIHADYISIQEATSSQLELPNPVLRPMLCIEAEVPGNVHLGNTIFGHPLIVEAIETYFVVVAAPVSRLEQASPPLSSKQEPPSRVVSTSKMVGNYLYTRARILDPLTGYDLVPCVDHQLSRASLLQAMLDALAMVCPEQTLPRYLLNLLEEERAIRLYRPLHHPSHHHHSMPAQTSTSRASVSPVAIFGMEHTALGEVVFAGLEGVVSTLAAWVLPKIVSPPSPSHSKQLTELPPRKAAICIQYDPQKLTYCTLAKFAIAQHSQHKLGRPSGLTLYYKSNEEHMAAQMHTRAHYRNLVEQVDPTNPAKYYYSNNGGTKMADMHVSSTLTSTQKAHETIRISPLQQQPQETEVATPRSSASSTGSSSEESYTGINNSANRTHPGYKVPDYDGVVEHAAAKAVAAAGKEKPLKYKFILKPICAESLQLQGSKPSLRESHLRFVPLTPYQATRANQLVYQGKFHLAMKLLSPRQGMLLMHALRSGRPRHCGACDTGGSMDTSSGRDVVAGVSQQQEMPSSSPSPSSFASPRSGAPAERKDKQRRKSGTGPGTSTPKPKELSPKASPSTRPLLAARRRPASTVDISKPTRSFPKQAPRISLNPEAMRQAANAVTESLSKTKTSFPQEKQRATDLPPPVQSIETRPPPSNQPASTKKPTNLTSERDDIVYRDVVDVPMLEAWKAFIIRPKGSSRGLGYDDSMLRAEDVYSEHKARSYSYFTDSDGALSVFTSSTIDD